MKTSTGMETNRDGDVSKNEKTKTKTKRIKTTIMQQELSKALY